MCRDQQRALDILSNYDRENDMSTVIFNVFDVFDVFTRRKATLLKEAANRHEVRENTPQSFAVHRAMVLLCGHVWFSAEPP